MALGVSTKKIGCCVVGGGGINLLQPLSKDSVFALHNSMSNRPEVIGAAIFRYLQSTH